MIVIARATAKKLIHIAQEKLPEEACGFIIGNGNRLTTILPINNIATNPEREFQMEPSEQAAALYHIHTHGYELVTMYHSHPNSPARPSPTDIAKSHRLNIPMLIVSFANKTPELGLWEVGEDEIQRIELVISDKEIEQIPYGLSNTQRMIAVVGGIVLLLFLIWVAISLLPPAPDLTPNTLGR